MNTRTLILLLIILWLLSRRRLAKTSQAANQSNISAPEQEPAAPNSKFQPLFDFVIPEAEIRKQQEEEAKTNTSGSTSFKRSRTIAKFEPTGFGLLYSGYVTSSDKNICPQGFKIPTKDQLSSLGTLRAIKSLNTLFWNDPNTGAVGNLLALPGPGLISHTTYLPAAFKSLLGLFAQKESADINLITLKAVEASGSTWSSIFASIKQGNSILAVMENPNNWREGMTVTDLDGNIYGTIKIGENVWLKSLLAVKKFNDGTPLLLANSQAEWQAATDTSTGRQPCFAYPNFDINNVGKTSQLY